MPSLNRANSSSAFTILVPASVISNAKYTSVGGTAKVQIMESIRTVFIHYNDDRLFPSNRVVRNVSFCIDTKYITSGVINIGAQNLKRYWI